VILISGPSSLHPPAYCEVVKVTSADEMRNAVMARMDESTLVIKAAAVADFRPASASVQKLKRTGPITLELEPTEDILAEVVRRRRPGQLIVGFAAETENRLENGRAKLLRKGADAIVMNDVSGEHTGIDSDLNAATFLTPSTSIEMPEMPKRKLAERILDEVVSLRRAKSLVVEVDEAGSEDPSGLSGTKDEIVAPAARRLLVVE
jgi:phosphopantothenoylcysteine decarboxylase/phosphopantothenate--cysteine ligase